MVEGHQIFTGMVPDASNLAVRRNPVDMDVEGGHEDADECRAGAGDRVIDGLFQHDFSISRTDNGIAGAGMCPFRITIEKEREKKKKE
jgi:hypothetical protein